MDIVHEKLHTFIRASRVINLRMRKFSDKSSREYQNTHFIFHNFFFFFTKSWRSWNTVEEYGRAGQATDDNIIQRMRLACG